MFFAFGAYGRQQNFKITFETACGFRKDQLKIFLFFLFAFSRIISAQGQWESDHNTAQKSNLEIFYYLADSSASNLLNFIPDKKKEIRLNLNLGNDYSVLGNKIISSLQRHEVLLSAASEKESGALSPGNDPVSINYVIDNAKVKYGEIFRRGFLGDYYIPRNIFLSGNFVINSEDVKYNSFSYTFGDTVRFDDIKSLENSSFPFTQGEVPAEPFFSGLLEPVVAVGTAAVALFLFFTIRSK